MSTPTLSQFIKDFTDTVERFGDDYIRQHGEAVNGRYLLRALIRWTAATIAAAPAAERKEMLAEALSQIQYEVEEAKKLPRRLN